MYLSPVLGFKSCIELGIRRSLCLEGVRTGNPSGLTHLAVASSQRVDALAKKLARKFGEEATKEVLLSTVLHVRQRLGLIRR